MRTYEEHFFGLVTQLDVIGWCVYATESEFQALKTVIEADCYLHQYSLRKRDKYICETYVIK